MVMSMLVMCDGLNFVCHSCALCTCYANRGRDVCFFCHCVTFAKHLNHCVLCQSNRVCNSTRAGAFCRDIEDIFLHLQCQNTVLSLNCFFFFFVVIENVIDLNMSTVCACEDI